MKIKSKRPQAATARAFALACMCATGIMLPSHAGAGGPLTPLIQGYVQESVAGRSGDLDSLLFHRQTLHLEGSGDFSRRVSFRIEGDVLRDDADFQTGGAEIHSRLREAYVKFRFRDFDLRLGRMQVGWGEADGLIVSDQVSPLDLTYFIVPEFDEIRLGVDGATLDYYFSGGTEVQLLWIGKFTSPDFAVSASPWSFVDTDVFTALGLNITAPEEPATNISNSEFGLRISGHPAAADWSLGYLRSWDDRPALRLSGTNLVPVHEMFDLITANLAWPVAKVMIRVDSAYEHGRLLSNTTAASTAAAGFVSREDLWRTLVGVDLSPNFEWWPQADVSLQMVHERVMGNPQPLLTSDSEQTLAILRLAAGYANDTIKPWVLAVADLAGDNSWVQAKVDWEPADGWRFSLEADAFFGHAYNGNNGGTYGRFAGNDMVSTTVRYSF